MSVISRFKSPYFYAILLLGVVVFLSFNRHSKSTYNNYHSVIWADKAGYYIYLPATFIYNWDASKLDTSVTRSTGNGFILQDDNKINTKYTYGVALLEAPFFLTAHALAKLTGEPADGFSRYYHWSIMMASAFYLFLGLFFLGKFLRHHFNQGVVLISLSSILLATNLYYYTIDDAGMSHVFSFMAFSLFLFAYKESTVIDRKRYTRFLVPLSIGLIIAIRPINIVFPLFLWFWDLNDQSIPQRLKRLVADRKALALMLAIPAILLIPQLAYWHHLSGKFLYDSYVNEGFSNWAAPQLGAVWFSPHAGLFLYTPLMLCIVAGWFLLKQKSAGNAWLILILFLVVSYIFGSWWSWHLGCGFGHRGYVEYFAIFSVPLGYFISRIWNSGNAARRTGLLLLILVLSAYNLKLNYSYPGCWMVDTWDFAQFFHYLFNPA